MKQRTSQEIARAARDGAGIDAAARRAVVKEIDARRKLGLPISSTESLAFEKSKVVPHQNGHKPRS